MPMQSRGAAPYRTGGKAKQDMNDVPRREIKRRTPEQDDRSIGVELLARGPQQGRLQYSESRRPSHTHDMQDRPSHVPLGCMHACIYERRVGAQRQPSPTSLAQGYYF